VTIRIDKTGFLVSNSPALEFCDAVLRGVGQVMFQNNTFTGAIFLAGIFLNSALFGIAATVGAAASTATAYALGADREQVRTGLHGFNGALAGIALAYFPRPEILTWVYLRAAAACCTVVTLAYPTLCGNRRPYMTAPFIIVTLVFVLAADHFGALHTTGLLPAADLPKDATAITGIVNSRTLVEGFFKGVAQVFFQNNILTGVVSRRSCSLHGHSCSPHHHSGD